jgi:phage head maturation protease
LSFGKIYDTSLVTRPAYPTTSVEGRSEVNVAEIRSRLIEPKKEEKEVEEDKPEMRKTSEILYNYFSNKHKARL